MKRDRHMNRDRNQIRTSEQLASTRQQLAGDLEHLQKLWLGIGRTNIVIEQAAAAYMESRTLLKRVDASGEPAPANEPATPAGNGSAPDTNSPPA